MPGPPSTAVPAPHHPALRAATATYLAAVDAHAPGLVEGLYLTGSAALGDFRPRTSDVDFVAVTARPLDATALAALERAHRALRARRPRLDGLYVTWNVARRGAPRSCASSPSEERSPG